MTVRRRGERFISHILPLPLSLLIFAKKVYPAPQSRQTQAIRFTASELLRNKFEDERTGDMQPGDELPPFYLKPLRELVAANSERDLAFNTLNRGDQAELD